MSIESQVRYLNRTIEDNYDIIWQETWYPFYDRAIDLAGECSFDSLPQNVIEAAAKLAERVEEGGDVPSQDEWFDICEGVFLLTLELYNAKIVPVELLDEFPYFYETAGSS